jgi:murein DD-endopeptidase MepM/ murein hydrolase activator NlpD
MNRKIHKEGLGSQNEIIETEPQIEISKGINYFKIFEENIEFVVSNGFDFPVGKPDGKGYYNAQKFQENNHLGDDWNGVGGGNSDLGDSIYAIGNGYISEAKDYEGGWGNVIRIIHLYKGKLYESLYAHCDSIYVKPNQFVNKGDQIATIGNCDGIYYAHLHLEIRDSVDLEIGGGYSTITKGYLNPTEFISKNR